MKTSPTPSRTKKKKKIAWSEPAVVERKKKTHIIAFFSLASSSDRSLWSFLIIIWWIFCKTAAAFPHFSAEEKSVPWQVKTDPHHLQWSCLVDSQPFTRLSDTTPANVNSQTGNMSTSLWLSHQRVRLFFSFFWSATSSSLGPGWRYYIIRVAANARPRAAAISFGLMPVPQLFLKSRGRRSHSGGRRLPAEADCDLGQLQPLC